ncbi:MAG: monovalent cation/H+ antiporter complex subunit F [Anaerolineales bacterium]|nr:MAG: monovalent cation/H+ antiporter complex subunit F [Anaerolineales bacterium]
MNLNMVSYGLLILAFLLAFLRMIRDPNRNHRIMALDRVVALDLMATLSIGFMTLYAIETGKTLFLDVAMVLALIAFLGTVAFARYLEKGR